MEVRNLDLVRRTIFNPIGKTKAARRVIPMTNDVLGISQCRVTRIGVCKEFQAKGVDVHSGCALRCRITVKRVWRSL